MRYSRQRELILDIVRSNAVHPTAEWVYEQARKVMPTIGIATVYRNLNYLADSGRIGRIPSPDGAERYDGRTDCHYHMKCRQCGGLFDLKEKRPEIRSCMERMIENLFCIEASDIQITTAFLEGVCSGCAAGDRVETAVCENKKTEE